MFQTNGFFNAFLDKLNTCSTFGTNKLALPVMQPRIFYFF